MNNGPKVRRFILLSDDSNRRDKFPFRGPLLQLKEFLSRYPDEAYFEFGCESYSDITIVITQNRIETAGEASSRIADEIAIRDQKELEERRELDRLKAKYGDLT